MFILSMLGFVFGQLYWDSFIYHLQLISVFLAIYAAMAGRTVKKILSTPFIAIVGGMCYTIYLYHFAMLHIVTKVLLSVYSTQIWWADFLLYSLVALIVVLVTSSILFKLFEKPFMRHDWYKRARG